MFSHARLPAQVLQSTGASGASAIEDDEPPFRSQHFGQLNNSNNNNSNTPSSSLPLSHADLQLDEATIDAKSVMTGHSHRQTVTASSDRDNKGFISPYSKAFVHRLKLINEKRASLEDEKTQDPIAFRARQEFYVPGPDLSRRHSSRRSFNLYPPPSQAYDENANQEEWNGKEGPVEYVDSGCDSTILSVPHSRRSSRSRSRNRSVSTHSSRSHSRERSQSPSFSRSASRASLRSDFARELQRNRSVAAEEQQRALLLQEKANAYRNYLRGSDRSRVELSSTGHHHAEDRYRVKDDTIRRPWLPSGHGDKHARSSHLSVNVDALNTLAQKRVWAKTQWPGFVKELHDNRVDSALNQSHELRRSRSSDRSAFGRSPSASRSLSRGRGRSVDLTSMSQLPIPLPVDHIQGRSLALRPNSPEKGRESEMQSRNFHDFLHSNSRNNNPSRTGDRTANISRNGNIDSTDEFATRTSRNIILNRQSRHIALTIRLIDNRSSRKKSTDGVREVESLSPEQNENETNCRITYGILVVLRDGSKTDLIHAIEQQFHVQNSISDISISSTSAYARSISIVSLSLNTIPEYPLIDDNSDIIVYLGGAKYEAQQQLHAQHSFLRDGSAMPAKEAGNFSYWPKQDLGNSARAQLTTHESVPQDDKLFYNYFENNIKAFNDYARREQSFVSPSARKDRSRAVNEFKSNASGVSSVDPTFSESLVPGRAPDSQQLPTTIRDGDGLAHAGRHGSFSLSRGSLSTPRSVSPHSRTGGNSAKANANESQRMFFPSPVDSSAAKELSPQAKLSKYKIELKELDRLVAAEEHTPLADASTVQASLAYPEIAFYTSDDIVTESQNEITSSPLGIVGRSGESESAKSPSKRFNEKKILVIDTVDSESVTLSPLPSSKSIRSAAEGNNGTSQQLDAMFDRLRATAKSKDHSDNHMFSPKLMSRRNRSQSPASSPVPLQRQVSLGSSLTASQSQLSLDGRSVRSQSSSSIVLSPTMQRAEEKFVGRLKLSRSQDERDQELESKRKMFQPQLIARQRSPAKKLMSSHLKDVLEGPITPSVKLQEELFEKQLERERDQERAMMLKDIEMESHSPEQSTHSPNTPLVSEQTDGGNALATVRPSSSAHHSHIHPVHPPTKPVHVPSHLQDVLHSPPSASLLLSEELFARQQERERFEEREHLLDDIEKEHQRHLTSQQPQQLGADQPLSVENPQHMQVPQNRETATGGSLSLSDSLQSLQTLSKSPSKVPAAVQAQDQIDRSSPQSEQSQKALTKKKSLEKRKSVHDVFLDLKSLLQSI